MRRLALSWNGATLAALLLTGCNVAPLASTRSPYEGCSSASTNATCGEMGTTTCEDNPLSGQGSFDSVGSWCTASCTVASDCPPLAGHVIACVALASRFDQGTFCALPCKLDDPKCPSDTSCQSVEPANGADDPHYCLP